MDKPHFATQDDDDDRRPTTRGDDDAERVNHTTHIARTPRAACDRTRWRPRARRARRSTADGERMRGIIRCISHARASRTAVRGARIRA